MLLVRITFTQLFVYGLEVIPLYEDFRGKTILDKIEIIQRMSIRAIIDVPFCTPNEIVEIELESVRQLNIYDKGFNVLAKINLNLGQIIDGFLFYF